MLNICICIMHKLLKTFLKLNKRLHVAHTWRHTAVSLHDASLYPSITKPSVASILTGTAHITFTFSFYFWDNSKQNVLCCEHFHMIFMFCLFSHVDVEIHPCLYQILSLKLHFSMHVYSGLETTFWIDQIFALLEALSAV